MTPPDAPEPPPQPADETWSRVQRLFDETLGLPADERERRLSAAEPALAEEVRSLLAAHAASSGFLDPPEAAPHGDARPGDRLGPYRVLEEIGRGGMGVVFRARRDDEAFTKDVAIKLIEPGMRSGEVLRRFRDERQILARLEHPNIARVLDGGTAPDGSPYLVLEYVEGRPLQEWCDEHTLSIDARLELFRVVCEAVRFAHQRLVVHRDLKSDNVLVDEAGSPRLLDFGIAKILAPEGAGPVTLTAPMQRMLTPDYASPEQVRGEPATVSADVYSLGVVLFELLTGRRPYHFTTRTPEEILRVVTQQDPVRPSLAVQRAADEEAARLRGTNRRELSRRLAGDLDHIVLTALERDPARRYASVGELAEDLRRHLAGEPVRARGASRAYRASRFVRRHRLAVAMTGSVAIALLAGVLATAWQAGIARRESRRATRRFEDVRRLAHAVMFDLHDAIASLPGSTPARELLVQHALVYLGDLSRESGNDPGLQHEMGVAYAKIADVQGRPEFPNLGQTAEALANYQRAMGLLDTALAAAPESTGIARDRIVVTQRYANLLGAMGRHDEALAQALDARERISRGLAERPDDVLWRGDLCVASDHLIDLELAVGDTAGAMNECRTNLDLARQMMRLTPTNAETRRGLMIAQAKTANVFAMLGQRDSARAYFVASEALAREAREALPENTDASRDLSIVYGMHGGFLAESGHLDSALVYHGLGIEIVAALAAADPKNALGQMDVAEGETQLGALLERGRRHAEAARHHGEAYERYARIAAADPANVEVRARMARCARAAGEASAGLARATSSPGERERARAEARRWLAKSLEHFRALERSGGLAAEDRRAAGEVERALARLAGSGTS